MSCRQNGCPNPWDCATSAYCRAPYWYSDNPNAYNAHVKAWRWYRFVLYLKGYSYFKEGV